MSELNTKKPELWLMLATIFTNAPTVKVAEELLAKGNATIEEIRRTYFEIVAPGMSLLRLTHKNRQKSFSRQEILEVCIQFQRPRYIRPLVQLFGKFLCRRVGGIQEDWKALEAALCRLSRHTEVTCPECDSSGQSDDD